MTPRTYDELVDYLRREFQWRADELAAIRAALKRNQPARVQSALVRGGIALLYAHWEGYLKDAGTAYLNYTAFRVKSERICLGDLASPHLGLALAAMCSRGARDSEWTFRGRVAAFLRDNASERANIKTKSVINTRSNLDYAVLEDLLCTLGLDVSPYELKRQLITRSLVGARNSIAHGEYYTVKPDDFLELYFEIIPLMREFKDQIDNAAAEEAYLWADGSGS